MPNAVAERIYESFAEEPGFRCERVTGTIPADLHGTALRSGPGVSSLGGHPLNFFDGHALIAGVSFRTGEAVFRARGVRTDLLQREVAADALLQRRVFTNLPSRWKNLGALAFGNSAMHDVYAWGSGDSLRVIAGNDPGHVALDPATLETRGREDWGGAVGKGQDQAPMPYRDPHTGHLVGWVKKNGGISPDAVKIVELDGGFRVVRETPFHALSGSPVLLHDQRATERFVVVTEQPLKLSVAGAVWGAGTVYDALRAPQGATAALLVIPRDGGPMRRVSLPTPCEMAFHLVNAYEDGETLTVDAMVYAGRIRFERAVPVAARPGPEGHSPAPTLARFVIDLSTGTLRSSQIFDGICGDAPEVADAVMGRRYRFAYLPSLLPNDDLPDRGGYFYAHAIAKVDVDAGTQERWDAGADAVLSPPTFVPREGATAEDDGYLLTWALREAGTSLLILRADALTAGPIATIDLGLRLPGVSHTRWAPDVQLTV